MNAPTYRRFVGTVAIVAGLATASGAFALDDLKLIAPAKPGGGWDQTARAMQEVMQGAGTVKAVTVAHVAAAGTDHILAGLIAQAVGADATKVNYVPFSGGGEALAAVMGGHVTAGVSGLSEWIGQIQAGELRGLAISSPERIKGVDIPTLKE